MTYPPYSPRPAHQSVGGSHVQASFPSLPALPPFFHDDASAAAGPTDPATPPPSFADIVAASGLIDPAAPSTPAGNSSSYAVASTPVSPLTGVAAPSRRAASPVPEPALAPIGPSTVPLSVVSQSAPAAAALTGATAGTLTLAPPPATPSATVPPIPAQRAFSSTPPVFSSPTAPLEIPLWLPHPGIGPLKALGRFFRKSFTFSGRASLSEYWWVALFLDTVLVAFVFLMAKSLATSGAELLADPTGASMAASAGGWKVAYAGFILATFIPRLSLLFRRLHDVNKSGILVLAQLTGIGSVVVFVFTLLPSNAEGTRFDSVPRF
jgi:uncharacterized membrane protein YhaH (DUF805 family)